MNPDRRRLREAWVSEINKINKNKQKEQNVIDTMRVHYEPEIKPGSRCNSLKSGFFSYRLTDRVISSRYNNEEGMTYRQ